MKEQIGISEIPPYGMRAYALFFLKHGSRGEFTQHELDWIVGESMKKKNIFCIIKIWLDSQKIKRTLYLY